MDEPEIVLHCPGHGGWRAFRNPVAIIEARSVADVGGCLREIDRTVSAHGYTAAGYVAYEAAAAFGFHTHAPAPDDPPLVWFGLFPAEHITAVAPPGRSIPSGIGGWVASMDARAYAERIDAIGRHIEAGDTYQINFTFRLRTSFDGEPRALFNELYDAQRGQWAAYLDLGRHVICSASPELFFASRAGRIVCEPMKGTARRGRHVDEDRQLALGLRRSEKDRAENVMIVDVVRNDLGRVAEIGSIRVPRLFDVSRYPNVWQMTSRVTARSPAALPELFEALFPAASITGAPKIRASEIIRTLEDSPRGVYTGAIGWVAPGGASQFNVAIRTVTVDRATGVAAFGVGSGIVWDSRAADEYDECRLKAQVLTAGRPAFELIETLAWSPAGGFLLLERHLQRLRGSAAYFGFRYDHETVREALERAVAGCTQTMKVRLLLAATGACRCSAEPLPAAPPEAARAALSREPVDSRDVWLYHKTTRRETYDRAARGRPGYDEVILWNTSGEITEGTTTNVVLEIGGRKVTPPVDAGLLPGTFRAHLLAAGEIEEAPVRVEQLPGADRLWIINSVRGWREATLVEHAERGPRRM